MKIVYFYCQIQDWWHILFPLLRFVYRKTIILVSADKAEKSRKKFLFMLIRYETVWKIVFFMVILHFIARNNKDSCVYQQSIFTGARASWTSCNVRRGIRCSASTGALSPSGSLSLPLASFLPFYSPFFFPSFCTT